jgi:hypothetical protein
MENVDHPTEIQFDPVENPVEIQVGKTYTGLEKNP